MAGATRAPARGQPELAVHVPGGAGHWGVLVALTVLFQLQVPGVSGT